MKKFFQGKGAFLFLGGIILLFMVVAVVWFPGEDPDTSIDIEIEGTGVRLPEGESRE